MPRLSPRRDEVFEWVCRYADEMDGPMPSINKIAGHFKLNYKTVYYHVMKLIVEGRLRQERGKLVVVGSEWIEPATRPVRLPFDS
jgi:DNA-binding transcriptional regulator YhcF (GntR family)